jgi:hypothetical protein
MTELNSNPSLDPNTLSSQGRGPRLSLALTAALLVGSFALGFVLVIVFSRTEPVYTPAPLPKAQGFAGGEKVATEKINAPETDSGRAGDADKGEIEANAPPEVPPGKIPDGVSISGVLYLKCWDSRGVLYKGAACDALEILEKRLSTRLYVVDRCARRHGGQGVEGTLSLGMNVIFSKNDLSFWAGPSSTLEESRQIGTCVRRELAGLPLYEINHKHDKYRIFFSIAFEDPEKQARRIKKLKQKGRLVDVTKDHVRVRKAPEDGYPFGKVSTDTRVTLVERKDAWCRVITPKENEGWMICDALDI